MTAITRDLHIDFAGRETRGRLVIGKLRRKRKRGELTACWSWSWSLSELHPQEGDVCGEDPLNALQNCLRLIRLLIQNHKELGYEIWWLQKGDEGGLEWVGALEIPQPRSGQESGTTS